MQSKLTPATVFRREYLYTINDNDTSLLPFQILFKSLSIKDLDFLRNIDTSATNKNQLNLLILQKSIISFINVYDKDNNSIESPDISILTLRQINKLAGVIYSISTVSSDMYKNMKLNTTFAIDKKFQTDTWDCEMCQHKHLDTQRNCKFRDDYEINFNKDFMVTVDGEKYNHCPMYYKDKTLINDIFTCYNANEKGILPEKGGLAEQTEFFTIATQLAMSAVNKQREETKD